MAIRLRVPPLYCNSLVILMHALHVQAKGMREFYKSWGLREMQPWPGTKCVSFHQVFVSLPISICRNKLLIIAVKGLMPDGWYFKHFKLHMMI